MSLIIDVGHEGQGFDPGAVGNGIVEADMVLQISLYQFARFKELGVPVKITRTKTQSLPRKTRTDMVKHSGMKHCISNHINAGGGDGAEVIHSIHSNPEFAETILDELHEAGQNKRKVFSKRLSNNSNHDYYYMHRDTGSVETVIVEYGFLDSKGDDVIQLKRDWKLYAEAVVKAYCKFAKYKYVSPKGEIEMTKEFKDVPVKHTHVNGILKAFELGLMSGNGKGTFNPDGNVTRAELATVITRLYDKLKG